MIRSDMVECRCYLLIEQLRTYCNSGPSQAGWGTGGLGGFSPQFWAKQLTLSQPGGQIIPTTVLQAPTEFQTLRRACYANLQGRRNV